MVLSVYNLVEYSGQVMNKNKYIVVHCGLSSFVEYGTTISVVDCVKLSV
jgi:hypothetical protein